MPDLTLVPTPPAGSLPLAEESPLERLRRLRREIRESRFEPTRPALTLIQGGRDDG